MDINVERMTKTERSELDRLVRRRFKVARAGGTRHGR